MPSQQNNELLSHRKSKVHPLHKQDVQTTGRTSPAITLAATFPNTKTTTVSSTSRKRRGNVTVDHQSRTTYKDHANSNESITFLDEDHNHRENNRTATSCIATPSDGDGDDDDVSSHSNVNINTTTTTTTTTITVDEAIERLGMGLFQCVILTAAGLCFAADAMQVLMLSFLSQVLRIEWHLSDQDTALITSILFVGAIFGTLTLGPLADKIGRKPVFLLAASIISCFGTATAMVTDYRALLATLFVVGWGVGGLTGA
jgi:hypothetical protein